MVTWLVLPAQLQILVREVGPDNQDHCACHHWQQCRRSELCGPRHTTSQNGQPTSHQQLECDLCLYTAKMSQIVKLISRRDSNRGTV
jgi:hypothetical protein